MMGWNQEVFVWFFFVFFGFGGFVFFRLGFLGLGSNFFVRASEQRADNRHQRERQSTAEREMRE